jgi:HTH-type transcriptional regulator, competence development regulator
MTFGEYIKDLRLRNGMTLRQVEEITEVSNPYISLMERGIRPPPHPSILKKLAKAYNVTINEMMEMAGYLSEPPLSEEDRINWAYNTLMNDPEYKFGARYAPEQTLDFKRFVVDMYEKSTGKKLLK